MKGFALGLALKQRRKATRKSLIDVFQTSKRTLPIGSNQGLKHQVNYKHNGQGLTSPLNESTSFRQPRKVGKYFPPSKTLLTSPNLVTSWGERQKPNVKYISFFHFAKLPQLHNRTLAQWRHKTTTTRMLWGTLLLQYFFSWRDVKCQIYSTKYYSKKHFGSSSIATIMQTSSCNSYDTKAYYVAKCNLGKVNLETMLASGLLSCVA